MPVVKLNNDIFRTDFPVEALEVMPRGLHILKMKWAAGSHINQIIDTVNLWSKAIDDEPVALAWTAANEYAGEFWNKMSADAVKGAAFLYGLDTKLVKKKMIAGLIEMMALPVRPMIIADTISRFQLMAKGDADPGQKMIDPLPGQTKPRSHPSPPPAVIEESVVARRRIPKKKKSHDDGSDSPVSVSDSDDIVDPKSFTMSDKAIQRLIRAATKSKRQRRRADSDESDTEGSDSDDRPRKRKRSSFASFKSKVDRSVANRTYFDFTMMGEKYQEVMLLQDCGMKATAIKDLYTSFDPVATPQGVLAWITLCVESAKYERAEVADMLAWYALVMFAEGSSPTSRATYMKRFMATKMSMIGQWRSEFERDATLRSKFLISPLPLMSSADGTGGGRGNLRGTRKGGKGGKGGKGAGPVWICFGYADPLKVCRAKGKCRFTHFCASCGPPVAHTAATCLAAKTWDQAKADIAKAALGM